MVKPATVFWVAVVLVEFFGPPLMLRPHPVRRQRWLAIVGLVCIVESALMLAIPFEQHSARHYVYYTATSLVAAAGFWHVIAARRDVPDRHSSRPHAIFVCSLGPLLTASSTVSGRMSSAGPLGPRRRLRKMVTLAGSLRQVLALAALELQLADQSPRRSQRLPSRSRKTATRP